MTIIILFKLVGYLTEKPTIDCRNWSKYNRYPINCIFSTMQVTMSEKALICLLLFLKIWISTSAAVNNAIAEGKDKVWSATERYWPRYGIKTFCLPRHLLKYSDRSIIAIKILTWHSTSALYSKLYFARSVRRPQRPAPACLQSK